jgi:hypothetical protein
MAAFYARRWIVERGILNGERTQLCSHVSPLAKKYLDTALCGDKRARRNRMPGIIRTQFMNKIIVGGFTAFALLANILPAAAQSIEFTIVNESSVDLHYFYASPSNDSNWGDDLLSEVGVLLSGYEGTTYITETEGECLYDFKFLGSDGEELIAPEVDICTLESYTLHD